MDNIDSVSQKTKTWFRYELQNYPKTKTKSDGGGFVAPPKKGKKIRSFKGRVSLNFFILS